MQTAVYIGCCLGVLYTGQLVDSREESCSEYCSKCEDSYCIECYYGYWGHDCQRKCENCWLAGCAKHSGRCIQCQPGRRGKHCDVKCPANCRPSRYDNSTHCERHTGRCQEGCMKGWWGKRCQNECSYGCQGSCYQKDGACISDCKKGFYGTHCNKSCSEGCAVGTCSWLTGTCHGGCKCGYSGETCEDGCSKECLYPCIHDKETDCLACKVTCGMNCKLCDQRTHMCLRCLHGFYGPLCDQTCNENCIGSECDIHGNCNEGCKSGYYGDKCMHRCPTSCKSCKTRSTACPQCEQQCYHNSVTESQTDGDMYSETQPTDGEGVSVEGKGMIQILFFATLCLKIIQLLTEDGFSCKESAP